MDPYISSDDAEGDMKFLFVSLTRSLRAKSRELQELEERIQSQNNVCYLAYIQLRDCDKTDSSTYQTLSEKEQVQVDQLELLKSQYEQVKKEFEELTVTLNKTIAGNDAFKRHHGVDIFQDKEFEERYKIKKKKKYLHDNYSV